jgi:hypothetical protein
VLGYEVAIVEGQKVKVKWSPSNKKWYESKLNHLGNKKYEWTKQGDEFWANVDDLANGYKGKVKIICPDCEEIHEKIYANYCKQKLENRDKCYQCFNYSRTLKNLVSCENCGKELLRKPSLVKNENFCSKECQFEYRKGENHPSYSRKKVSCEYCKGDVEIRNYRYIKHIEENVPICCSMKCKNRLWAVTHQGEEHPSWTGGMLRKKCEWCNTEYEYKQAHKNRSKFCSVDCTMNHINSQPETRLRWIRNNKEKLNTKPQMITNALLDELDVEYINEHEFKYYSVDNYLVDCDLIIEVMGDYWHGNPTMYEYEKLYTPQIKSIIRDKSKTSFINNNYGIKILCLWETDLKNNPKLCKSLISEYIQSNGILKDYNSFNYNIDKYGILRLNKDITQPYFERNMTLSL